MGPFWGEQEADEVLDQVFNANTPISKHSNFHIVCKSPLLNSTKSWPKTPEW